MSLSSKVKTFQQLSSKEQKYILENMNFYKGNFANFNTKLLLTSFLELANKYQEQFAKCKDNQMLHAIYYAHKAQATANILGARLSNNDAQ